MWGQFDELVQDCSKYMAYALESLQSSTIPYNLTKKGKFPTEDVALYNFFTIAKLPYYQWK